MVFKTLDIAMRDTDPKWWETNKARPVIAPAYIQRQGTLMELKAAWIHRPGTREERAVERSPEICRGSPLSIQQNSKQCICMRKVLKARKRTIQKVWQDQCLLPPERQEKVRVHEAMGWLPRKISPQEWAIISPRLSTAPDSPNKS